MPGSSSTVRFVRTCTSLPCSRSAVQRRRKCRFSSGAPPVRSTIASSAAATSMTRSITSQSIASVRSGAA